MQVALIDRPEQPSYGRGRTVRQCHFDATGVRLRTVPFTAARVKAAFAKA